MPRILELSATNYRSLADVVVPLGPLNVLVGPNEAGKSNLLDVVQFLGDSARLDLRDAVDRRGGYDRLRYRGVGLEAPRPRVTIGVKALVTSYASEGAPDEYKVSFWETLFRAGANQESRRGLIRLESFLFKRRQGRGRRIQITGSSVRFSDVLKTRSVPQRSVNLLERESLGLATLPKLAPEQGGEEVKRFANLFLDFRVVNPSVTRAKRPSPVTDQTSIDPDGANLSAFLYQLREADPAAYETWLSDARLMVPGLLDVEFRHVQADQEVVVLDLVERGVRAPTRVLEASYGTVRILALLAVLNDPSPPSITAIEEIDHGLHPYVFDHLAERLREASARTQLILATHSPALVNRLKPSELIVAERDFVSGASRIPAIEPEMVQQIADLAGADFGLGEVWFSGTLGGVPE